MEEVENKPVDNEFALDLADFKLDESTEDETSEPTTEEVVTPNETQEEEDYSKLLEKLSGKVKYMDEDVKIDSVDNLITTYQKGLDYDRKVEKIKELESSEELTYLREKSKEAGMTPTEYVKAIKDFETKQQKEQEETEIAEMVENGIAETIARKVVETNRIAKELESEKLRIKAEQETLAQQKAKEAENDIFLQAYPNIDIKTIPNEVFKDAETMGLLSAYTKYENSKLKQELEIAKKNQENSKTSPVKSITEQGTNIVEPEDDFMRGFFSKK